MSIVTSEKLQSFAEKLAAKIESLFVKKESGKGLSTNDYTHNCPPYDANTPAIISSISSSVISP